MAPDYSIDRHYRSFFDSKNCSLGAYPMFLR